MSNCELHQFTLSNLKILNNRYFRERVLVIYGPKLMGHLETELETVANVLIELGFWCSQHSGKC